MKVLVVFSLSLVVLSSFTTFTQAGVPHQHAHHFPNKRQAEYAASLSSYEVITPFRADREGGFVSHHLHETHAGAHDRSRRDAHFLEDDNDLHYVLSLEGEEHQISLAPNRQFLAPHAVVERRRKGGMGGNTSLEVVGGRPSCHYYGYVSNHAYSKVAISTCEGLTGYVSTDDDEYLIEPVRDHVRESPDHPHPHLVYKRSALPSSDDHTCSASDSYKEAVRSRTRWENQQRRKKRSAAMTSEEGAGKSRRRSGGRRRRMKRSVSVERNVEVTVVADKKMVDYYSNEDITTYILTVMNMVSTVYHDASIGNAVNIYIVRIMLLEDPQYEEELDISHNADNTLRSFCTWQQMINPGDETHPYHHDVAVLITRFNICSKMTDRCSTLGVAEIAGMCQPHRSCNVNEDTGLQIAYTIAHELGHNFGMNHDGPQNGCESQYGVSQHVMSPHLTSEPIPVTWSNCSRKEITHFLDRDWGACLEDEPPKVEYDFPELPPGAMYDADHQCRLSFGTDATHCSGIEGIERVCQTLWCHLDNRCITRMEPAAEGTKCGVHKWCVMGRCVTIGERPAAIHGNWGSWSSWSSCSRTCGAGTSTAVRHCDNPAPANGGRYCTGDRKRYQICNTQECPDNGVSFRAVQCSNYDKQQYKGAYHNWLPVMFDDSPCQLDCKPDNEFYSVKLQDTVLDGTPCKPGTKNMCINGMCKRVTCDWTIEGTAQEDRCGLCHGDGTQCVTFRDIFNVTRGSGYEVVATFPADARNVKVQQIEDAANYLAVMDNSTGEYFLNGNWIIQWSGEYYADGTMIYYSREGETEELYLPGPLKKPLTVLLLFQTENPGIDWEYTLPHENATYTPEFSWEHSDWSVCSVTCGGGKQISKVQCMEQEAGLVEDKYCINQTRPDDLSRVCNTHACPAWWWSGPWQPCSVTCGTEGTRRRTVICVRSFGPTEQMALLDSDCDPVVKPHEFEMCNPLPACPEFKDWSVGPWTQVCTLDPCDFDKREVKCVSTSGMCDPTTRPAERRQCGNITCGHWDVGEWSKCSSPCGEGAQFRRVSCAGGLACRERDEPKSFQNCTGKCLEEETVPEIEIETVTLPLTTTTATPAISTTTMLDPVTTTTEVSTVTEVDSSKTQTSQPDITSTASSILEETTGFPTSEIMTTMNPNLDVDVVEDMTSTSIPTTVTQTTPIPNVTTVISLAETTISPVNVEVENEDLISDPPIIQTTMMSDEPSKEEEQTSITIDSKADKVEHQDAENNDTKSDVVTVTSPPVHSGIEQTMMEEAEIIPSTPKTLREDETVMENLNEVDVDSEPVKSEDPEMLDSDVAAVPKSPVTEKSDVAKPKTTLEESVLEEEETSFEKIAPLPTEQETALEQEGTILEEEEIHDAKLPPPKASEEEEEERPDGIIEDKINMEDFEVIQVIEIKGEGKKKKDRKKVLIHTGKEAVNVLHDLAEEQAAKKVSTSPPPPKEPEPVYMWIVGEWSKCSAECGGGMQSRTVDCLEDVTGAIVDQHFCKEEVPVDIQSCHDKECGEWIVGDWEECSAECDLGERQRSVECPDDKLCPSHTQPPEVEPCDLGPCAKWVEGPWSLCTRSCGGGYQIRHVKCVDIRTQEAARTCPRDEKPKHKMSCHKQRCPKKERGQHKRCRDHMDSKLCKRLKHMCSTNFFRIKCCRTCFKKRLLEKLRGA